MPQLLRACTDLALTTVAAVQGPASRWPSTATGLPDWLTTLEVARLDPSVRQKVTLWPGGDRREYVREVLDRVVADKPAQLDGWGIGIVALLHGLDETLADVLEGLAPRTAWPFWRTYWVDAAGSSVAWDGRDAGAR